MKVYVYAICKNESKFARRWMDSMSEADGVYVLDTGSEDGTVQLLRDLGAVVEVEVFDPWRFDYARNRSLELVPEDADVCVCTDLDEFFHPGWRKLLEQNWTADTDRAAYRYTWNFNPDGSEGFVFWLNNMHTRHGWRWTHPVHEVLERTDGAFTHQIYIEGIQLDHRADDTKPRSQYLPLLEMSVAECPEDDRNMHYLGREYYFYRRWEDAIRTLERHLKMPTATWADERCASMRYIARCQAALGNRVEAKRWLWRAIGEAPHLREPYLDMAKLLYEEQDWDGLVHMCRTALRIAERPKTYICEAEAWGSRPYDYLSLGLYYSHRPAEAIEAVKEAIALSPGEQRLRDNLRLMQAEPGSD